MDELDRVLNDIDQDTISGSSELADKLLITLIKLGPQFTPPEKFSVRKKIDELSSKKPFFATLSHLAEALRKSDVNWSILQAYKDRVDQSTVKISEKLISILGTSKKVLLHSHSKTIVSVFGAFAGSNMHIKILQTVSEPGGEGIIQAEKLQSLGYDVKIIEDDPALSTLQSVDLFITGADLILPSHFINKSGTLSIAEKINELGKSYYVLSDYRKFTATDVPSLLSSFERIPRSLVTTIITGE